MSETSIVLADIESIISEYSSRSQRSNKNGDADTVSERLNEEAQKVIEEKIMLYADKLANDQKLPDLRKLLKVCRPYFALLAKAKASKLIRALVEFCLKVDQGANEKVELVEESIAWALEHKRVFLKRTLETRLIKLFNEMGKHTEAIKLGSQLNKELKKLDDRELLIEVTLEESRAGFFLNNFSKAKTALVSAKTAANGAYTSAVMQASIDLQSGILYSADEKDFKTAFSYFYESFEGFVQLGERTNAIKALKYMCLCKIMLNEADQINSLLDSKLCQPYVNNVDIEAAKALAVAFKERKLEKFEKCLTQYSKQLNDDLVVKVHSNALYESMIEKEISRVIEPYSMVEISYVCKKIGLPQARIEKKLATMLLDQKFSGMINQSIGTLTVYPKKKADPSYEKAMELLKALGLTVDGCYQKSMKVY